MMIERQAQCSCGQLTMTVTGEPQGVGICHCHACQRRTGSPFGQQARFRRDQTSSSGVAREYTRWSEETDPEQRRYSFCPECGSTVWYVLGDETDMVSIPVGAFADETFPPPVRSVWEATRHPWVAVPEGVDRFE